MTAILLALGSSVGYGVSNFLASRVVKRVAPVLLVLSARRSRAWSCSWWCWRSASPTAGRAWPGDGRRGVGAAGLVAYYHALATGQTAIVAPPASSGAVLPLLVDLARGSSRARWPWPAWSWSWPGSP